MALRKKTETSGPAQNITGAEWDTEVTCTTASATTDRVLIAGFALGSFWVPVGSSITSIEWYAAPNASTAPGIANDSDGVDIVQTVAAGEDYDLPSALAGRKIIAPKTDAAGTLIMHFER